MRALKFPSSAPGFVFCQIRWKRPTQTHCSSNKRREVFPLYHSNRLTLLSINVLASGWLYFWKAGPFGFVVFVQLQESGRHLGNSVLSRVFWSFLQLKNHHKRFIKITYYSESYRSVSELWLFHVKFTFVCVFKGTYTGTFLKFVSLTVASYRNKRSDCVAWFFLFFLRKCSI